MKKIFNSGIKIKRLNDAINNNIRFIDVYRANKNLICPNRLYRSRYN